MEGTMATILIFAGNFSPNGWRFCDGSILDISEYNALFSLIGTTYGGDGIQTFALPDLRGRIPVGTGTGAGLSNVSLGQSAGSEQVTMTLAQLPAHSHLMSASLKTSSSNADGSSNPANPLANAPMNIYAPLSAATGTFLGGASVNILPDGNSLPIQVIQPFTALNYVICTEGIYPSRG